MFLDFFSTVKLLYFYFKLIYFTGNLSIFPCKFLVLILVYSHVFLCCFDRLTCVYLASKVEEFNVSITQFVGNLKGDREKFANTILTFELLLMDKLNYHLLVHNPYRPMEGLFIDLKVGQTSFSYD